MVCRAAAIGRRRVFEQHELDVVFAIGHPQVDPGQGWAVGGASAPDLLEAENIPVELHRRVEIRDDDAHVHDACGGS